MALDSGARLPIVGPIAVTRPSTPIAEAASAVSTRPDTRTAAMELADLLAADFAGPADLLVLFGSFHHRAAFMEAATIVRRAMRAECCLGSTVEWVVGRGRECEHSPGLTGLALRLPGVSLSPVRFDLFDGPPQVWSDDFVAERLGGVDGHRGTFLVADPFSMQVPALLDRCATLPGNAGASGVRGPIVGGMASGSSQPGANVLLLDDMVAATGAVGVSFRGPVTLDALVSPGCAPFGPTYVITKARGNVIESLGGLSAVDALHEAVETLPMEDRPTPEQGVMIGFAIDEYRERFGRGDFVLRGVLGADAKRGTLAVGDYARIGRTIRFHRRDAKAAAEDLQLLLDREEVRDPPLAVLLASCESRGRKLFGTGSTDAKLLARRLGDPPLAGFYAAGEIGPVGARSFLHGHAIVAALLRPGAPEAEGGTADAGGGTIGDA